MRSLIKAHRRSDSSASDIASSTDTLTKPPNSKSTPLSSPMMLQHPTHLTPPHGIPNSSPSSMSSPKKLLTPIKRMFGHHSKSNTNIASANESLNSVVFGEFVPPQGRKTIVRSPNSFSNLSDVRSESYSSTGIPRSSARTTGKRNSTTDISPPQWISINNLSDSSFESQKKPREKGMCILAESIDGSKLASTASNISIANSENNFVARPVLSQDFFADFSTKGESDFKDENGSENSDASSQFSFVKDIHGGRNTSVKYYKTKKSKAKGHDMDRKNVFNVDDFGYEEGALSDYDFENNGIEYDEQEEYDYFDGNDKYDDFLQDDQIEVGLGLSNTDPNSAGRDLEYSVDLNPIESDLSIHAASPTESTYHSDLLDTYLDPGKSPSADNLSQNLLSLPASSDKTSATSPLINGVTFGTENRLRSTRKNTRDSLKINSSIMPQTTKTEDLESTSAFSSESKTEGNSSTNRQSIANMMDLLSNLESKEDGNKIAEMNEVSLQSFHKILKNINENESAGERNSSIRKSIINMMDTLSHLEESFGPKESTSEPSKSSRASVIDMMNNLALLETSIATANFPSAPKDKSIVHDSQEDVIEPEVSANIKKSSNGKRYSWFYNSEGIREEDRSNYALEEDLLDEVNLLPEDGDIEDCEKDSNQLPEFFRSNSYNKKPQKVLMDNSLQKNKIETPLKTVTFYHKGNSSSYESSKTWNLSRGASFKSTTSATSITEDDCAENNTIDQKKSSIGMHLNTNLNDNSNESIGFRSFNLEPIREFNSPIL